MGLLDRVKNAQQQAAGAMSGAGGLGGMMGGGDMAAQAAAAQLTQRLSASGVEAPGVIKAIRPTGETDMGGGQRTEVDVTIAPDGGDPYGTTITQSFLPAQLQGLDAGSPVTVKYDPGEPSAALIYSW
jgi:Protein of unknown function (DUF3592)